MICADECQNVALPSVSFQVNSLTEESDSIGLEESQISPLTSAAKTFLAKPSEIDKAI